MKSPAQVVFHGMEASVALKAAAHEKVRKLEQFCADIIGCRVGIELLHKHHHQGRPYGVRIDLTLPGHELAVSRVQNEDAYVALRDAFDDMRRRLEDVELHASDVVRMEHSLQRQTLATRMAVLRAAQWRCPGPALHRLRGLIEFQLLFEEMCHRPKVDLLAQYVAARSRTVARVLVQAQFKREGTARLVLRTHGLVAAVEREEPGSDAALQALLEQQQGRLLGGSGAAGRGASCVQRCALAAPVGAVRRRAAACRGVDDGGVPAAVARRHPECGTRFEDSGFPLSGTLDFGRMPLFRGSQHAG